MIIGILERDDAQTYASHGNAILGIRDSGKSYTAMLIAERLHDAGIPWITFDAIGKWQHIRSPGRGKGYPVVVVGGMAGDLPLTVEGAPAIVRAAMKSGISVIIDLYDMKISKADWKRIVASCIRVLLYENEQYGLRHIFLEEAAEFVPQRPGPDQTVVYAEIEKLARMGGNCRLGYTLINQRAEEVAKAVLELCDSLFLHRQKGKNSLNSLAKWLDVADVQPGGREIIKSLPTLPQGECWAWMSGTDRPVHVKVPVKNSFEPDRRAMGSQGHMPVQKRVDASKFVGTMKSLLEDMNAQKAAAEKKTSGEAAKINTRVEPQPIDTREIARDAFELGVKHGRSITCNSIAGDLRGLSASLMRICEWELAEIIARYGVQTGVADEECTSMYTDVHQQRPQPTVPESTSKYLEVRSTSARAKPILAKVTPATNGELGSSAIRMLTAFRRYYPKGLTFDEACTVAGFISGNGYFYNGKKHLIDGGHVLNQGGDRYFAHDVNGKPMTRSELQSVWSKLKRPAPEMLAYLLAMPVDSIEANTLASKIKMKPGNGYWYHGLSQLKSAGIIEDSRGPVRLTPFVQDMKR